MAIPANVGIGIRAGLLFVAMILLIVVAAAPGSLYKAPTFSAEEQKQLDNFADGLDALSKLAGGRGVDVKGELQDLLQFPDFGLFKASMFGQTASLPSALAMPEQMECKDTAYEPLWRWGMQATCITAIICLAFAIGIVVSGLRITHPPFMVTCLGHAMDILSVICMVVFIMVLFVVYFAPICNGKSHFTFEKLKMEVGFAFFLAPIALVLTFVSFCISCCTSDEPSMNLNSAPYNEMESM